MKKPFDRIEIIQAACTLTGKWSHERALRGRIRELEDQLAASADAGTRSTA